MEFVLIKQGPQTDILLLKGILEENHIDSVLQSKHGSGFVMRAGSVLEEYSLFVQEKDAPLARELAEAFSKP